MIRGLGALLSLAAAVVGRQRSSIRVKEDLHHKQWQPPVSADAGPCPPGSVLEVSFATDPGAPIIYGTVDGFLGFTVQEGDVFEYEMQWLDDTHGNADLEAVGRQWRLRDDDSLVDAAGLRNHCEKEPERSALAASAKGRWLHRSFSLGAVVGHWVDLFVLAAAPGAGRRVRMLLRYARVRRSAGSNHDLWAPGQKPLTVRSYLPGEIGTRCVKAAALTASVRCSAEGDARGAAGRRHRLARVPLHLHGRLQCEAAVRLAADEGGLAAGEAVRARRCGGEWGQGVVERAAAGEPLWVRGEGAERPEAFADVQPVTAAGRCGARCERFGDCPDACPCAPAAGRGSRCGGAAFDAGSARVHITAVTVTVTEAAGGRGLPPLVNATLSLQRPGQESSDSAAAERRAESCGSAASGKAGGVVLDAGHPTAAISFSVSVGGAACGPCIPSVAAAYRDTEVSIVAVAADGERLPLLTAPAAVSCAGDVCTDVAAAVAALREGDTDLAVAVARAAVGPGDSVRVEGAAGAAVVEAAAADGALLLRTPAGGDAPGASPQWLLPWFNVTPAGVPAALAACLDPGVLHGQQLLRRPAGTAELRALRRLWGAPEDEEGADEEWGQCPIDPP